jgi:hypothetical protein
MQPRPTGVWSEDMPGLETEEASYPSSAGCCCDHRAFVVIPVLDDRAVVAFLPWAVGRLLRLKPISRRSRGAEGGTCFPGPTTDARRSFGLRVNRGAS